MNGRAGETKTEASQKSLPIDPRLAGPLQELRKRTLHQGPQDWVFANEAGRPRGQQDILHRHLRPAAQRAGIGKIGWHTFRHSYSTMLRGAGTDIKVQQELLRHSTIQSTLNTYTQAVSEQKRAANSDGGREFCSMKMPLRTSPPLMGAKRHSARGVGTRAIIFKRLFLWRLGLVAGGGFVPQWATHST